jgi:hypothetical protein
MPRALFLPLLAAALALAPLSAHASHDAVQFGSNIDVTGDNSIHDAVCFFCSVRADGVVSGDVVVFFGDIHLAGEAHHDVVNFFGTITAADNTVIRGDMVSFFGSVHLGENVSVGKDLVAMFGIMDAPASVSVGHDRVVQPPWVIAFPPLVLVLIIFLIVHEYRSYRRRQLLQSYPFPPHP